LSSFPALVIEDDPSLAEIFAAALRAAGFESEIIPDGRAALTRLARSGAGGTEMVPALVVLDLHLPHASGEEVLRYIRADARLARIRVMLATADPLMAESLRSEATLVLLKPISFTQLRDLAIRLRPQN
jgi:two-component system cell cycle response regulator DivK